MNVTSLSHQQQRAVDARFDSFVAITGPARSGKSNTLSLRAERYATEYGESYFHAAHPSEIVSLALGVLRSAGRAVHLIDDTEALQRFQALAGPLFALEWAEFEAGTIDPEVGGLRSPERFLASAFRLVRKLRDADISAETFLDRSLAGATAFYANPPNFAHPNLIYATKDAYRDSLEVDVTELQRQYRREIDLAKILARLYAGWIESVRATNIMTARDALIEAIGVLTSDPHLAASMRERHAALFVDEAQEASQAARTFLEALYGPNLAGVTVAGDPRAATSTFRGARPDALFKGATELFELTSESAKATIVPVRYADEDQEARAIAEAVADLLKKGTSPAQIGIIFRSVCDIARYETALLEREIAVAVEGDVNIFADRRCLDALALLWNVWDPFRHDWLLRTLRARAMALSDATLAQLCAEPPDNQTMLFSFEDEPAPTARSGRWDPKRDLRLGWNVVYGHVDTTLSSQARERIQRFRSLRDGWIDALRGDHFLKFVARVWNEGLAREGPPGSAAELSQVLLLLQLLARMKELMRQHPRWTLGDLLQACEMRSESELECAQACDDPRVVRIMSVDAARGRSFDVVFAPDARAGSFPRWYVPDAFLFSPKLGMIPKDNVGEARAARTAKFSYYLFATKAREAYNDEERRAFTYAISRARSTVYVSASGRPTRGTTAPEFLEELKRGRPI